MDLEFIQIFFPSEPQAIIALRLVRILRDTIGDRVFHLRPNTTTGEICAWAEENSVDAVWFVMALEEQFGIELDYLAENFDQLTFRQLVEYLTNERRNL